MSVSQTGRGRDLTRTCSARGCVNRRQIGDPAFPGHFVMKPKQQKIERLRRDLARMKPDCDILRKPRLVCQGLDMRFKSVAKHRGIWPVSWISEALDVSRSGFHARLVRAPSMRALSDDM